MISSSSLLVDRGAGRQTVRSPRATDTVGATLRDGYAVCARLPDDFRQLLGRLDRLPEIRRASGRG